MMRSTTTTTTAATLILSWCCHHKHVKRFLLIGFVVLLTCINNIRHVLDSLHGHSQKTKGIDEISYLPEEAHYETHRVGGGSGGFNDHDHRRRRRRSGGGVVNPSQLGHNLQETEENDIVSSVASESSTATSSTTNSSSLVSSSSSPPQQVYKNRVYNYKTTPQLLIKRNDYIYQPTKSMRWDASPIVIEKYKLIFFTVPKVASTTFKQLFRKMMDYDNWSEQSSESLLPHSPLNNGLQYLAYYPIEQANQMMTDPTYTKAIFVRDPKQRFLSAFLDKAISNGGAHVVKRCCHSDYTCLNQILVPYGFLTMIKHCPDEHWIQQSSRMEDKYWSLIDFVGHFETMQTDTKRLLQHIGAWDDHGITGWGPYSNWSIFERPKQHSNTKLVVHSTNANKQYWWWTPLLEQHVEEFYSLDYENPVLNFTKTILSKSTTPKQQENHSSSLLDVTAQSTSHKTAPTTKMTNPVGHDHDLESSKHVPPPLQIEETDYIYQNDIWLWDASPIVIEQYNLIFFTIPNTDCTIWKKLFRKMMNYTDWRSDNVTTMLPHNPVHNGLKYLYDYPPKVAHEMMTDDTNKWTRAVFVQDPKQRFLTVFAKKVVTNNGNYVINKCCKVTKDCINKYNMQPHDFLSLISQPQKVGEIDEDYETASSEASSTLGCQNDPAWSPQHNRMESKYWKYINFVGHFETLYDDSYKLLSKIGAWDDHGKSGWGVAGTNRIFDRTTKPHDVMTVLYEHLYWYDAILEYRVEQYYDADYTNPLFNFTKQLKLSYTPIKPSSESSIALLSNQQIKNDGSTNRDNEDSTASSSLLLSKHPVQPMDFIYNGATGIWDSAPIVVEKYKLVFFTIPGVAHTTFKQLFRRMEGIDDWRTAHRNANSYDQLSLLPHDPNTNGLKYLYHYSREEADDIMTSSTWTKAVFIRDPKRRFVSSFVDQALSHDGFYVGRKCCNFDDEEQSDWYGGDNNEEAKPRKDIISEFSTPPRISTTASCVKKAQTPNGFLDTISTCKDSYWEPQYLRMESKYWQYITFIGHHESIQDDSRRLLQQIGAWDTYGSSGWGNNGYSPIFQKEDGGSHSYDDIGQDTIEKYLTPSLERRVEAFYAQDYDHPSFKFAKADLT